MSRMNYNEISVMETKLDDIVKRPRETMLEEKRTALRVAIEQLLDCFIVAALHPEIRIERVNHISSKDGEEKRGKETLTQRGRAATKGGRRF